MILVSIIIRTKNEERWISSCLRSVYSQTYTNFEVILVDNNSTDRTVEKAKQFPIRLVTIENFFPGKAINYGIRKSSGKYIVCLSGHCIPTSKDWLKNLIADLNLKDVAGVYGRQEPLSFSSDIDKRDLLITFGLDKKIQIKDSFFHNANSAFRKDIWEKFPFDENATNIEDRLWGQEVVAEGYKIIYEPNASVYHWHGIHQDSDPVRARNTVKILESMSGISFNEIHTHPKDLNILAVIPLRGKTREILGEPLIKHTITSAKESKYIDKIVISTDNSEVEKFARNLDIDLIFQRPKKLSEEYINVFDVLKYSIIGLEEQEMHFDIIVLLEEIYPFRDKNTIDCMIELLLYKGYDTVVSAKREERGLWSQSKSDNNLKLNNDALMPNSLKNSDLFISMPGLCCVTYPELIRDNSVFSHKVGLYEILNPISSISIRAKTSDKLASSIFQVWNNNITTEKNEE